MASWGHRGAGGQGHQTVVIVFLRFCLFVGQLVLPVHSNGFYPTRVPDPCLQRCLDAHAVARHSKVSQLQPACSTELCPSRAGDMSQASHCRYFCSVVRRICCNWPSPSDSLAAPAPCALLPCGQTEAGTSSAAQEQVRGLAGLGMAGTGQCWHSQAITGPSSEAQLCNVHGELLTGVSKNFTEKPHFTDSEREKTHPAIREMTKNVKEIKTGETECNDGEAALKCWVVLFSLSSHLLSNL